MNNAQLYVAVAIPSFLLVLAWVTTIMQTTRLGERTNKVGNASTSLQNSSIRTHFE